MDTNNSSNASILQYISSLGKQTLHNLYNSDVFTCVTVFRTLQSVAKQYVMRLLFMDEPIRIEIMNTWIRNDKKSKSVHIASIKRLKELGIFEFRGKHVILNDGFRACIRKSLENANSNLDTDIVQTNISNPPSDAKLKAYGQSKWEAILHFMVKAKAENIPDDSILDLMIRIGLLDDVDYSITTQGFRFLFQGTHIQVWTVIIGYLKTQDDAERNQVLTFLFRLSFLKIGHPYSRKTLSSAQQHLLSDLSHLGLVYIHNNIYFYPTQLCAYLSRKPIEVRSQESLQGFIIVETTFRFYAYTSSDLQVALLNMFARIHYRLPGIIVGNITKKSFRGALFKSITAQDVVTFLQQYAHPQVKLKGATLIPDNVKEQLYLWEKERNRFTLQPAILLGIPTSDSLWKQKKQVLIENDMLLFENQTNNLVRIVAKPEAKSLLKQNKTKTIVID